MHKLIFIFLCAICFSILQTHKSLLRSPKQISQKNPESTLCIFLPELVLVIALLGVVRFASPLYADTETTKVEKASYLFDFPGQVISGDIQYSDQSIHFSYAFEGSWTPLEMLGGLTKEDPLCVFFDQLRAETKTVRLACYSDTFGLFHTEEIVYSAAGQKIAETVWPEESEKENDHFLPTFVDEASLNYPLEVTMVFEGQDPMIFNVNALLEENGNIESVLGQVFVSQGLFPCSSNDLEAFLLNEKEASMIPMKRCGFWGDTFWGCWRTLKTIGRWMLENGELIIDLWDRATGKSSSQTKEEKEQNKQGRKGVIDLLYASH